MKITALSENTSCMPGIAAEHGLSLYIETGDHRILFDTGASGQFALNAAKLGIDLSKVELAVMSHGHNDHTGGLTAFFQKNGTAPVYVKTGFERPMYNRVMKYIGAEPSVILSRRLRAVDRDTELCPGVRLVCFSGMPLSVPVRHEGLKTMLDGILVPDDFSHEMYLIVSENGKNVLFSGCAHRGIVNLIRWSEAEEINTFVCGFHFMKIPPEEYSVLDSAAEVMKRSGKQFLTCHCTGQEQYRYLKGKLGTQLTYLSAGETAEL